jgi:hypothetical protein
VVVWNGGHGRAGVSLKMFGVRCHLSSVSCHKGNHALNSARNTVLVTQHVSKLKMLHLRNAILHKFKFKVVPSAQRD